MDLEGIVSKRSGSRYVSGRTRAWLKKNPPRLQNCALDQEHLGCGRIAADVRDEIGLTGTLALLGG